MRKKQFFLLGGGLLSAIAVFLFFRGDGDLISVPISFSQAKEPCFSVCIEGKNYWAGLDLGSKFPLCLERQVLDELTRKKPQEESKWRDIKGNFYTSPAYLLPEIQIGQFTWKNIAATQEESTWAENTILFGPLDSSPELLVQIGRPILDSTNLLLDASRRTISFCKNKKKTVSFGHLS